MKTNIAVCLITSLWASGCMLESHELRELGAEDADEGGAAAADRELRDIGGDYRPPVVPELDPRTVEVMDGLLVGDMGDYEDFVAPAYEATAEALPFATLIEIHGGEGYWVMTRLLVQGGLMQEELDVGAHVEVGRYVGPEALQVTVLGCSGPRHGSWTYDQGATGVIIDIEEGEDPDDRVMRFSATYLHEGRDQVVEGSFGYRVY